MASAMQIRAQIHLGELTPEDVAVELHIGRVDPQGEITDAVAVPMSCGGCVGEGFYGYESNTSLAQSGLHGFTVRVRPTHPDLTVPFSPDLSAGQARSVASRSQLENPNLSDTPAALLHRRRCAGRSHDWWNREAGSRRRSQPRNFGEVEEVQQVRLCGIAGRKVGRRLR